MKKGNINFNIIFRVLGSLLFIEAFFLFLSMSVSLLYSEEDTLAFLITIGIAVFTGLISRLLTKKSKKDIGKREGFIIVSFVWIVFSFVGSLPFIISGYIPGLTNAFFETISGFTTTGSSILNDIESLPHGLLFWRSIIQWMGGMGIIVLSLAILPILGIGGMQLFTAEVPGPVPDKLHPRIKETAKRLWLIYLFFTIAETILLMFGGMDLFDAVNHSFTTMATGGYSTKQASIAYWDSPYIHYVIILFMFIAGTNFTLAYFGLKFKFKKIIQNEEFRYYFGFTFFFAIVTAVALYFTTDLGAENSFRDSLFQVVSLITTTGYATADYLKWIPFLIVFLFVAMFFGGSAGSTGGGIKIMRIVLLIKNSVAEFKRLIHPQAIIPVRFNHNTVKAQIINNVLAFIVLYILIFVVGTVVMSALGLDFDSAMGAVIATLGNIGPGIGNVGPAENFSAIPAAGKWFLSFLMLVGRLELFTVLILFSPTFWRK
ncbi:MAG: TrkH family potassium uptake protein [Bacteroidales bacterium]|nr:TrkH family potassium uptake protein [Bacteroidales bacterium]